jgi:dTDP-4-dehydrorhamnose reductase
LKPQPTSSYPTPARRPLNSVLSNEKLVERLGLRLASWTDALDAVFEVLKAKQA